MGRGSRLAIVLVTTVLAAILFAGEQPSALAIDPPAAADQLLALTNISRTSNGFSALPRDQRLAAVARSRSEDMIARNYFDHLIPPEGRTVRDLLEALGLRGVASENIAFNTAVDFMTVQLADSDFMNSPSHRKNVLEGRWDRVGTGAAEGSGKRMYTVVFLQSPAAAPAATSPQSPSAAAAGRARVRTGGERAEVIAAPQGLIDSLVSRMLRLFLNL